MIRFSYTIFYVKEVQKALDFYTAAFDLKVKFLHESGAYGELLTEGVTLAFASEELASMNVPSGCRPHRLSDLPQACEIAFTTEDPQKLYKRCLEHGATSLSSPEEKPWGQTVAYIRDPQGILIEICSELP